MNDKKEKRGRKALLPEQKKPPQPTIKINDALFPFVKLLKTEHKAKRVSTEKLNALTRLLLDDNADLPVKKQATHKPDDAEEESEP
ncbi:MAG: hypothetical protein Q8N96_09140 [Methylovulum sp.]|nr:hypothetical protein [Methylovulum sp.]